MIEREAKDWTILIRRLASMTLARQLRWSELDVFKAYSTEYHGIRFYFEWEPGYKPALVVSPVNSSIEAYAELETYDLVVLWNIVAKPLSDDLRKAIIRIDAQPNHGDHYYVQKALGVIPQQTKTSVKRKKKTG